MRIEIIIGKMERTYQENGRLFSVSDKKVVRVDWFLC